MKNKVITNCNIDEDLHREIKIRAAREGMSLKDVLNGLLRKALKKG